MARNVPYMGGCQNYGPFLGTLNIRCRMKIGTQKGTIMLTTTHMSYGLNLGWSGPMGEYIGFGGEPIYGINYKFSPGLICGPVAAEAFVGTVFVFALILKPQP